MSYAHSSTFRYNLRHNDGPSQTLQVRIGYLSRLISEPPSHGRHYRVLEENYSTTIEEAQFPLPHRELQDPLLCQTYISQLLSPFNLGNLTCATLARKITAFLTRLVARNHETTFHVVAEIDYIRLFWPIHHSSSVSSVGLINNGSGDVMVEETVILEDTPARRAMVARGDREKRAAPAAVIERLKKEKFDGFGREELGDCSVCYEELNGTGGNGKEVCKIPCGHVYHKSCILSWVQKNNSCPLCRRKLE